MKLIINSETINKCGGGSSEYWFSYNDYSIKNIRELNIGDKPDDIGQTAYFVSIGIIPFITISHEEIIRALIKAKGSTKLNSIFDKIEDENLIESFWKYYNAYPELKLDSTEFADKYIKKKIALWCDENNVNYAVED